MAQAPGNQTKANRTRNGILRGSTALLTLALAAAVTLTSFTAPEPVVRSAQAQDASLTVQFRTALEPHGRWTKHNRWGEVWIPAKRDRDWRPYTAGRWVYTDEWGWYWASDEDFGWVTYHYGRWVLTSEYGWVWIPGNEWGPAWVQWRRGDRHAGWAPLPPQEVIYDYDDSPDYWIFVSFNNFTAPNVRRVIVPPRERVVIIRETVVVNRTIIVDRDGRDRRARFAVNPGIEPRIVAARAGRPIQVSNVRPAVVAGTVGIERAVEVRGEEARKKPQRVRAEITESKERVEPAKDVPPPQALKKGEEGRFGERPPRAAKEQAQQQQQQPDGAKEREKGGEPAATKTGPDDAAKAKADDAAKAKADEAAKSKTDDAAKAKADDAAKSKADDAARGKAPEPKGEPKQDARDAEKGKAEPKQAEPKAEPKSAPEPKQATPKAEPKSAPEPKQVAPKAEPKSPPERAAPKAEPKQAPEPRAVTPKAEPKSAPAPQAAPKAPPPQAVPKAAPAPQAAPKAAPAPQPAAPKAAPAPAPAAPPAAKGKEKE